MNCESIGRAHTQGLQGIVFPIYLLILEGALWNRFGCWNLVCTKPQTLSSNSGHIRMLTGLP
uniref:Uncharacterized protein n=1 Tax=Aegilops tauschii subsp. strangulata TaxID=200361 RepID=A0A453KBI8_AEGTS